MKEGLLILTLILNTYLFWFLSTRRDRKRLHEYRATYLTLIASSIWVITNFLFLVLDPTKLYWVAILSYISAFSAILGVLIFLLVYNQKTLPRRAFFQIIIHSIIAGAMTIFVSIPGMVLEEIVPKGDSFQYVTTPYLTIYGVYILCLFICIVVNGVKLFSTLSPADKNRTKLFFYSSIFVIAWGLVFNLLFPMFENYSLTWLGPVSMVLWISTMIYSIVRYRLFDIRFSVGITIFSLISSFIAIITFYAIYALQTFIWGSIFTKEAVFLGIFLALIYIRIQKYADVHILGVIEKYFIYSGTDPNRVLQELTDNISNILEFDKATDLAFKSITSIVDTQNIAIITENQEGSGSVTVSKVGENIGSATLENDISKLFDFWRSSPTYDTVFRAEIDSLISEKTPPEELKNLYFFLQENGIEVAIPLVTYAPDNKVIGTIVLGENSRARTYTTKDITFVEKVSKTISVAIERALLYQEVQNFNITLQKKVDDATKQLKIRNDELQDLYNNLEDIYQKEKDLMDIAGHEFRTPASILKNNLYLLKKRLNELSPANLSDEKVEKYLRRLIEGTDRQIKLVNTFLESARIDNQRFEIEVEMHDMAEIVSEAVSDAKQFAKDKGLQLIFDMPSKKMHAEVDSVRIREVIDNLINNAMKYTSQGYVEISITDTNEKVIVSVKDSGIGIKKEDQPLLFKKFSRVENYIGGEEGSIVRPGGTGLGLYVAKTILDAHGGNIRVESEEGKGTKFTFDIPKKQPSYVRRVEGAKSKLLGRLSAR